MAMFNLGVVMAKLWGGMLAQKLARAWRSLLRSLGMDRSTKQSGSKSGSVAAGTSTSEAKRGGNR